MKLTPKQIVFMCLQVLFVAVVPLIIVFIGYDGWGEKASGFKIYFGTLATLAVVLLITKKVIVTPWLDKQKIKTGNLEAELVTTTDKQKIILIEDELKKHRVIETVFNWVLPITLLIIAVVAFNAVERAIVKFSNILLWVMLSEFVGFVFAVLDALCVEGKHKNPKKKQEEGTNK